MPGSSSGSIAARQVHTFCSVSPQGSWLGLSSRLTSPAGAEPFSAASSRVSTAPCTRTHQLEHTKRHTRGLHVTERYMFCCSPPSDAVSIHLIVDDARDRRRMVCCFLCAWLRKHLVGLPFHRVSPKRHFRRVPQGSRPGSIVRTAAAAAAAAARRTSVGPDNFEAVVSESRPSVVCRQIVGLARVVQNTTYRCRVVQNVSF